MRKRIFTGLLALLLILVLIVYHNSYSIALRKAGISKGSVYYIDSGIDNNGNEYRAVFAYTLDDMVKILLLTKNNYGVWKVTQESCSSEKSQSASIGWMRFANFRRYTVEDENDMEFEVHIVYGANNAIKRIEIPAELLPPNVSANVFQAGEEYVIHFVAYGGGDALSQISPSQLLEQIGCIQP